VVWFMWAGFPIPMLKIFMRPFRWGMWSQRGSRASMRSGGGWRWAPFRQSENLNSKKRGEENLNSKKRGEIVMIGRVVDKLDTVKDAAVRPAAVRPAVVRPAVVRPAVVRAVRPAVIERVQQEVDALGVAADVIRVAEDVHAMVAEEEVHEGVIKSRSPTVSLEKKKPNPSAMRCKRARSRWGRLEI
jgi:hypothetical protein